MQSMSRNSQILIERYCQTNETISFVFSVFAIALNAISREQIAQSPWGFHQTKA